MSHPAHLFTPNPLKPGRLTCSVAEYQALFQAATIKQRRDMLGVSPGAAASIAGISRQAIHRAIDRGSLQAYYVYHDDGSLAWVVISDKSLSEYIERNRRRRA